MAKEPAWGAFSLKNQRGETVWIDGAKWTVETHLRNGIWRASRLVRRKGWVREYTKVRLDLFGHVVEVPHA